MCYQLAKIPRRLVPFVKQWFHSTPGRSLYLRTSSSITQYEQPGQTLRGHSPLAHRFSIAMEWHHHSEAVDLATRTGCLDFNKAEFLHATSSIRNRTFKSNTIRAAFRCTGLILYDPSHVLHRLQEFGDKEPNISSSSSDMVSQSSSPTPFTTPLTIRTLQWQGTQLRERSPSPSMKYSLDKFIKGSLAQAHARAQTEDDLRQTQAAK